MTAGVHPAGPADLGRDGLAGLPARQRDLVARAWAHVDQRRLRELAVLVTSVPSPTGEERPLAEELAARLRGAGLDGRLQPLDDRQANAWGRLAGTGSGPSLMLYAPVDTFTAGTEDEDLPWIGPQLRTDMRPGATVDGPYVTGLGASNPKGHAACVLAAAEAVAAAGVPLRGDLVAAFGAGGMPTNARPLPGRDRANTGQGVGASFLLEQGLWTDAAVIAKPGWGASAAEVGLVWFDVWVGGTHTYVGSRHRLPYVNAVAQAATVVHGLEAWFERYAAAHTDAVVSPQGVVSSIEGGWPRLAAATPGRVRIRCDVRLAPGRSPASLAREFRAAVAAIADRHPGLDAAVETVLAIPGSATPEDAWVVRSTVAAWEAAEGRPHEVPAGLSGATDANILRNRGIPTVRIGMPKVGAVEPAPFEVDFARGMNTVDVRDMERLTRLLVRVAVDTCTRTFEETGDRP
ncbi:hypothetical protein [Geodermatophilus sp. SYSU D00700]